jgi:YfiH family protein
MGKPGKPILTVPRFERIPWLVHGFGAGEWTEEDFSRTEGLKKFRPVIMRQIHSEVIHRLEAAPGAKLEGDSLVTNVPGLLLVVRTADCLPVFLVDEENRAVASVHCGWRGTQKRILEKTVLAMGRAYGSRPAGLLAALGPCIGSACYEVGPEVREGFGGAGFPPDVFGECQDRPGKYLLDLKAASRWLLEGLGVKESNVFAAGACTHCDLGLLSFRRTPGEPRRMYNFIGLRP